MTQTSIKDKQTRTKVGIVTPSVGNSLGRGFGTPSVPPLGFLTQNLSVIINSVGVSKLMTKLLTVLPLTLSLLLGVTREAIAHGTKIEYRPVSSYQIKASYDSGEPMKNAQVIIFAPDSAETPWKTSRTDAEGNFNLIPDSQKPGVWLVEVRQAGHGDILRLTVEPHNTATTNAITSPSELHHQNEELSTLQSTASPTPLQLVLMGASGLWGFVGTALFFSRRGQNAHS